MDWKNFVVNARLSWTFAVRDQRSAYKRAAFGVLWLVLTPFILLLIYSMVFGIFLGVRWSTPNGIDVGYVLPMFIGLVCYLFFSDLVSKSTGLLVSKRNLLLKSSISTWVVLLSNFIQCSFQFVVSIFIVLIVLAWGGYLTVWGVSCALIFVAVNTIFLMAVSVIFAVLGPFVGDLSQGVRLGMRVIFYTAPVTYPMESVPEHLRIFLWLNPLTFLVEPFRFALLYGRPMENGMVIGFATVIVPVVVFLAVWMYRRTKEVLTDVL